MYITTEPITFWRASFGNAAFAGALAPRKITYTDLTYCIKGEMHYKLNGEDIILHAGDAVFFPQDSVRERLETDVPVAYYSINVALPNTFVPEVQGYLPNSLRFDTVQILESMTRSFESLSDEKNQKCTALFFYLYYQLIETVSNNDSPHVKQIKQYIASHLTENISLADVAEHVHLAPNYCCTIFSQHTGQSLVQFITAQRISLAKRYMVTSDRTLSEISEACGFEDYNYFSRIFKKYEGMSASQYRKLSSQHRDTEKLNRPIAEPPLPFFC